VFLGDGLPVGGDDDGGDGERGGVVAGHDQEGQVALDPRDEVGIVAGGAGGRLPPETVIVLLDPASPVTPARKPSAKPGRATLLLSNRMAMIAPTSSPVPSIVIVPASSPTTAALVAGLGELVLGVPSSAVTATYL
jgi:hypothetical protein